MRLIISFIFSAALTLAANATANESPRPIEPAQPIDTALIPAPFHPSLTLGPEKTHSGYTLPRWVSLKYDTVNGRKGPGKHFPHLWTFQRKGMPVIVINEMDHWRKIRDIEGGESWVRSVALSGHKTAIVTRSTHLLKSTKRKAKILATLTPNLLVKVESCKNDYCYVEINLEAPNSKKKGPSGYINREDLWGIRGF
ncbi:MAG: SH3 domain-containing protein [Maricaulaceae bacterium]